MEKSFNELTGHWYHRRSFWGRITVYCEYQYTASISFNNGTNIAINTRWRKATKADLIRLEQLNNNGFAPGHPKIEFR